MNKKTKYVFVEINDHGDPVRILKNCKATRHLPVESVREMTKAEAVGGIRLAVFERTKQETGFPQCEWCGQYITWKTMEMHEKIFKGKRDENGNYGEVSLDNCVGLCRPCHQGPNGAHADRKWQSAKIKDREWTPF
jgi:5-methylcytosine-specific restriction endonuclease McrA